MLNNLMRHRITINRPTISQGAMGGQQVNSFAALYTSIPAFVQPLGTAENLLFQQRNIQVSHEVFVNQALSLQPGDQIVYGSRSFTFKGYRDQCEMHVVG